MAEEQFDAYYKWLGIPPDEQPPNYYRLLGVRLFEADLDVIANAADQRMSHLRTFQAGKHAARSQAMLNEISGAKLCLLSPARRGEYDQTLRQSLAREMAPPPPRRPPVAPQAPTGPWPPGAAARPGFPSGAPTPVVPVRPAFQPMVGQSAPQPSAVAFPTASVPDALGDIVDHSVRRRAARRQKRSLIVPGLLFLFVASAGAGAVWMFYRQKVPESAAVAAAEAKPGVPDAASPAVEPPKPEHAQQDVPKDEAPPKAGEQSSPSDEPAQRDVDPSQQESLERLIERLKQSVTAENVERSQVAGAEDGELFDEPHKGALLVGLELRYDHSEPQPALCGVSGIFSSAKGSSPGRLHGAPGDERRPVRAKPGYALGAIEVAIRDERVRALRLVFWPITEMGLAKHNRYATNWLNDRGAGQPVVLGGDSRPLIGLCGSADATSLRSLGVILPPKPAPEPGQAKPAESAGGARPVAQAARPGEAPAQTAEQMPAQTSSPPGEPSESASANSAESMLAKPLLPSPSAAEQAEALATIRELFKVEFAAVKSAKASQVADKRVALADDLARKAKESGDNPAAAYVMFDESRKLAAQAGDSKVLMRVTQAFAERFAVDEIKLTAESLAEAEKAHGNAATKALLASNCVRLSEKAARREQYELAEQLVGLGLKAAKAAGDSLLTQQIAWQKAAIGDVRREHVKAQDALATLKTNPDDPAANAIVGRYRCFYQNDWPAGLPLLAKGDDPALASLAATELSMPSEPVDRVKLGNGWLAAASENQPLANGCKIRARQWYEAALPELTGVTRLAAVKALEDMLDGHGLTAEYFSGVDSFDNPVRQSVDATVDFHLDEALPEGLSNNRFTARWTGWLAPPPKSVASGPVGIIIDHDAGIRLWLDGKLVIEGWGESGVQGTIVAFSGGRAKRLKLEYFSRGGKSPHISLRWAQRDGFAEQPIGPEALFQDRATVDKVYSAVPALRGEPLNLPTRREKTLE